MLSYYEPVRFGKITASCDNVVLDGKLNYTSGNRILDYISTLDCRIKVDYWQAFKIGTYRHLWTLHFDDGISATLQLSLNDGRKPNDKVRLDYNPNKCNSNYDFVQFHNFFVSICKYLDVKRWDFALDYPVLRENCFLIKDQRLYSEKTHSNADRTQYLGIRSHGGYVKLYNKQIESNLGDDNPMTRLELTVEGYCSFDGLNVPLVHVIDNLQMRMDELEINETERFILNALLKDMDSINMLGRYMKQKMKAVLDKYVHRLEVDFDTYYKVMHVAKMQCELLPLVEYVDIHKPDYYTSDLKYMFKE